MNRGSAKGPIQKISENRILYYCPRCKELLIPKRKRKNSLNTYCAHCGEPIYTDFEFGMGYVTAIAKNLEEARYLFDLYKELNGTSYKININEWIKRTKEYPLELYFVFPDHKNYSKFVKRACKTDGLVLIF